MVSDVLQAEIDGGLTREGYFYLPELGIVLRGDVNFSLAIHTHPSAHESPTLLPFSRTSHHITYMVSIVE